MAHPGGRSPDAQTTIAVKGRSPRHGYRLSLPEVFGKDGEVTFSVDQTLDVLNDHGIRLTENQLRTKILGYRGRTRTHSGASRPRQVARPFQMRAVLRSRLPFNLRYQDAIIKTELERALARQRPQVAHRDRDLLLQNALVAVSAVLRTTFDGRPRPLLLDLTHLELDHVVLSCLSMFHVGHRSLLDPEHLHRIGVTANERAVLARQRFLSGKRLSMEDVLRFSIYAGVVWWSNRDASIDGNSHEKSIIRSFGTELRRLSERSLALDDLHRFSAECLDGEPPVRLVFVCDDNGELAWDLLLLERILAHNRRAKIACVVHDKPVGHAATAASLRQCIEFQVAELPLVLGSSRFSVVSEPTDLAAVDLRYLSTHLATALAKADVVLVKGAAHYETVQSLPTPVYYLFTAHGSMSLLLTGLDRNQGVFARIPSGLSSYRLDTSDGEKIRVHENLKSTRVFLRSAAYRRLLEMVDDEAAASRLLQTQLDQGTPRLGAACAEIVKELGRGSRGRATRRPRS